jgi:arylsulfatase A-like enzyme
MLQAGFGVIPLRPGRPPGPDAFRLVIGDATRDTVITPLPRERDGGHWTDITIALDGFAGRVIDLELRYDDGTRDGERPHVAAYWSPPRIHDPTTRPPDRPNLLLITIDALRADHVGCYGYDRPTTPGLDRLADEGVRFACAVTQAPYTLPATASILTSLYPMTHRVGYGRSLRGIRTLPRILHERGYRTAAFADNPWLNPQHGFDVGFDRYVMNAPLTDPAVDRRIREWLRTADQPFFLWLHYLSPHAPYRAHPEYFSLIGRDPFRAGVMFPAEEVERYKDPDRKLSPGRISDIVDLYDSEIWFADRSIGALIRFLDELGVLDRTVVAVTADHGEEFKDHQGMGHSDTLFDELIRVPLLLRYPPALPAGRVVDTAVETIDLFPTLLDLLGIEDGWPPIEGESLLAAASGTGVSGPSIAFSDRPPGWLKCVTDGEHKLLRSTGNRLFRIPWGYRRDHLYDLRADPRETTDRLQDEPAVAARLRDEMSILVARSDRIRQELQTGHQETIEFNEDLIEQMKALGYIQ